MIETGGAKHVSEMMQTSSEDSCTDNQYQSDQVQNCTSPYEFFRFFMSEEFVDRVVDQSKMYAIEKGCAGKADKVTRETMLASQNFQVEPTVTAKRRSRQEHKYINVTMPALIEDNNSNMGGVDMIDKMVGAYRIRYIS